MKKKESLITAITFIVLIAAFATGIYFIVRLVNGPGSLEDGPRSGIMSGELKTYTHPDYGFTFNYPANFKLGKFQEGAGEVILIQGPSSNEGFQIFVSLYEEKNPLSKAIIEESAPDLKIQESTFAEFKGPTLNRPRSDLDQADQIEQINVLSFDTDNTHEIWFVVEGNLYQVTSYKEFGDKMEEIIKTIRFN